MTEVQDNKIGITWRPNSKFQESFASSSVDVVFGGGSAGGGKSDGLVLALAAPLMTDPDFRCLISRRSLGNQKAGGGFVEKFKKIFGADYVKVRESDSPRISFPNGTFCDLTYLDDSNMDKLRERAKGWEYDVIAIDELTEMSWEAFTYIMTRNRGQSKTFTGKFFATMNPKRSHWARNFLDWYIGVDGYIIPERNGVVRYFYVNGATEKDVVWGDSKEEVYHRCRISIDRKLANLGKDFSYKNLIKSFVFYRGKVSENKDLMESNPDYIGSIAASGGKMSEVMLDGNWNVDPDSDFSIPIPSDKARECFVNDPAVNGDKWVTVDLADFGTDNLVALSWNGFHVTDMLVITHSTPRENAQRVKLFAEAHECPDDRIIFDGTAGRYFNDYIPDARAFLSSVRPVGNYALQAATMKDLCYLRLVNMIKRGQLTFSEEVAGKVYKHQNFKFSVTVENEFLEECAVVRFDDLPSGKKRLWNKKRMNNMLGKGRSMDLLDPCMMRMYPCVFLDYGNELEAGFHSAMEMEEESKYVSQSIYDPTLWC